MENAWKDIQQSIRALRKNPAFSAIVILNLSAWNRDEHRNL
jgi:hypothetical protein